MTSEQNVPEVDSHQGSTMSPVQQDGEAQFAGQNVPHGMGQSKSSRRRRRKRKSKGPDAPQAAQSGEQGAGQSVGSIQGAAAPQTSQPQGGQGFQANAGQQQNGSSSGKRWKKKFRDRDRPRSPENPGNGASGSNGGGFSNNGGGYRDRDTHQPGNNSGGFKRKGGGGKQQRGPRSFVGPMDHSYRAVNGNFADTPPSTMDTHGNGNYGRSNGGGRGGYQSDSQPIDYSQGRTVPIPENAPTKIFF